MENNKDEHYTIDEHIHRYAIWTAARAASVSRFSNREISRFILESGLRNDVGQLAKREISRDDYKQWFINKTEFIEHGM